MKNSKRTLCFGDIHGYHKALLQVLEKVNLSSLDKLIFLGDYTDRGPESAQVIQTLIDLSKTNECIFIKGNHDEWIKDWLILGVKNMVWIANGGQITINSYIESGLLTNKEHEKFFIQLKDFYIDHANRGFVHGGFVSRKGLGYDAQASDYRWDRDLWEIAMALHNNKDVKNKATPKGLRMLKHSEIYIGHTPTTAFGETEPMHKMNIWNMDTGIAFYGKFTCMDINSKEFWQSDTAKELYN